MKKVWIAADDRPRKIPNYIQNMTDKELDIAIEEMKKRRKNNGINEKMLKSQEHLRKCGIII